LLSLIGRKEKICFATNISKYDRRFKKQDRDLIITENALYILGPEKITSGPSKGQFETVVKRRLEFQEIGGLSLSSKADDFVIIRGVNDYDNVIETVLKTELVTVLAAQWKKKIGNDLSITFLDT